MKMKCVLFNLMFFLFPGIQFCYSQSFNSSQKVLPAGYEKYNHSSLGENVFVFEPGMDMKEIQSLIDTIFNRQSGRKSEFSKNRYALLFKPGRYNLDVKVGYYMQVLGLGESPEDVVIFGAVRSNTTHGNSVLTNFWRSAENLTVIPTIDSTNIWGVSQAAPLRRVYIKGNLQLFDKGYASGGFLADSKIEGIVSSGPQQQWFSRNTEWGKWSGGVWNMMFVGVPDAPSENWPDKPFTTIKETPLIREKPYLVYDEKGYSVKIPELKENTIGPSWLNHIKDGKTLLPDKFYIIKPGIDNSESINSALKKGKNLLFTPGIYSLDKSLKVTRPGTVIMGIGMATLMPVNANSAMEISDVDGVTVCGIIIDAGKIRSETLFQVGEPGSKRSHESDPVIVDNAIETPVALENKIHHKIIFWLNGNKESIVKSIINGKGGSVSISNRKATMD